MGKRVLSSRPAVQCEPCAQNVSHRVAGVGVGGGVGTAGQKLNQVFALLCPGRGGAATQNPSSFLPHTH